MSFGQPSRRTPRYERLTTGDRLVTQAPNRCCAHPQCTTRLSRYNPDSTCSQHNGWTDASVPQRGRNGGRRARRSASEPVLDRHPDAAAG